MNTMQFVLHFHVIYTLFFSISSFFIFCHPFEQIYLLLHTNRSHVRHYIFPPLPYYKHNKFIFQPFIV